MTERGKEKKKRRAEEKKRYLATIEEKEGSKGDTIAAVEAAEEASEASMHSTNTRSDGRTEWLLCLLARSLLSEWMLLEQSKRGKMGRRRESREEGG